MNKLIALLFGIEWLTFNYYVYTQIPKSFSEIGKVVFSIWTLSILIGIGYILKNEKKEQ